MKVLSLFDGISCGMVALERAGVHIDKYFSSEIEESAINISKKNYPDIVRMGDVAKWRDWDIDWKSIDLVIGGSPCQGFSRNGLMLNFSDPRSKLFFVYCEILNHIKEINPKVKFLLENVEMKKEWRDVITQHLDCEPMLINSALVSAQNRPRLYWSNIRFEKPDNKGIKLEDIIDHITPNSFRKKGSLIVDNQISELEAGIIYEVDGEVRIKQATKAGYIVAKSGDGVNLQFPTSKTRRGRVTSQKSAALDCQCNICVLDGNIVRKLTRKELERLQTLPDGYTDNAPDKAARKAIGNGWTVDVIAHIFKGLKEQIND